MAIRDDFTAGEVLAAADLNDTFASKLAYPSGGNDGDLLAKDGTAAEWIAVPEAGLTLITTETFSAVSSVSVNGCFSATYRNYLILGEPETSGNVIIQMRLRESGSDSSATSYANTTVGLMSNGSFENISGGLVNTWSLCRGGRGFLLNVMNPFAIDRTTVHGAAHGSNAGSTLNTGFTINNEFVGTTSFDGFSIYPASGTITGFLRIYGYKD